MLSCTWKRFAANFHGNTRFDHAGKAISASPMTTSLVNDMVISQQHHDLKKQQHAVVHPQSIPVLRVEAPNNIPFCEARSSSSAPSRFHRLLPLSGAATHSSGGSKGKSASFCQASTVHTTLDGPSLTLSANQLITNARHNVNDSKRLYTACVQGWQDHGSTGAHVGITKPRGGLVTCFVPGSHRGPCSTLLKVHY